MAPPPLHLLTLAPIADQDKERLEKTFDSVHYGQSPELSWNAGPPTSVSKEDVQKATVVFGWQLPSDVSAYKQMPNLHWMMTPSAGADVCLNVVCCASSILSSVSRCSDLSRMCRLLAALSLSPLTCRNYLDRISGRTKRRKQM